MRVYIIIVTFNGVAWIDKCLNSIYSGYNIIVIDNNSTDATVQFIQENHPSITLIQQTKNLGFGAANNLGISYALTQGADYVFLLNQDAYLEANTIETLINIHKENKEYGLLSPIHLNGDGSGLDLNFSHYLSRNKDILFDSLRNKAAKTIYQVPFVNAAAWLLPKSTIEIIGGFDPIFYHYGEDDNYCQRLKYYGFKIGVVPQVFLRHDRGNRIFKPDPDGEKGTFKRLERTAKLKYGNINTEDFNEVRTLIKKRNKAAIKSFIKLRFKASKFYRKEVQLLKKIYQEIEKSRLLNKTKGSTYLDL